MDAANTIAHAGLMTHNKSLSEPVGGSSKVSTKIAPSTSKTCQICHKGVHAVSACEVFRKMDTKQRWQVAEKNRLCFNCLGSHARYECKYTQPCGIGLCAKNHHKMLHKEPTQPTPQPQPRQQAHIHTSMPEKSEKSTLLRIIPVMLKGPKGEFPTFVLLDNASTIMVDTDVAKKIGVDGPASTLCYVWTKKISHSEEKSKKVSIEIRGELFDSTPY